MEEKRKHEGKFLLYTPRRPARSDSIHGNRAITTITKRPTRLHLRSDFRIHLEHNVTSDSNLFGGLTDVHLNRDDQIRRRGVV